MFTACALRPNSTVPGIGKTYQLDCSRGLAPRTAFRLKATAQPLISAEKERGVLGLVCPICFETRFQEWDNQKSTLECRRCNRAFESNGKYTDMTLSSGLKDATVTLIRDPQTTTFQRPLVGFIYERGWRQNFRQAGFPGPDKEFEQAMELLSSKKGGPIVDLCCGSGLFTRRFLASEAFSEVISVDYSDAMLVQTQQFVDRIDEKPKTPLRLIRADVSRLPFETGSVDAIYSGAAVHCWPQAGNAFAEISRVLAPGGVFVFTTFTEFPKEVDDFVRGNAALTTMRDVFKRGGSRVFVYYPEEDLRDLCRVAGLENYEAFRRRLYICVRVNKPLSSSE